MAHDRRPILARRADLIRAADPLLKFLNSSDELNMIGKT
jgi:hypothetical protein